MDQEQARGLLMVAVLLSACAVGAAAVLAPDTLGIVLALVTLALVQMGRD